MARRYIIGMRRDDGHASCKVTRMASSEDEARALAERDNPGWTAGTASPMFQKTDPNRATPK